MRTYEVFFSDGKDSVVVHGEWAEIDNDWFLRFLMEDKTDDESVLVSKRTAACFYPGQWSGFRLVRGSGLEIYTKNE